MRAFLVLVLWAFSPASAHADSARVETAKLFRIQKPVNPENEIQTFVSLNANCEPGSIEFVWWAQKAESGYAYHGLFEGYVKAPNSVLRCNVLSRLQAVNVPVGDKAGCVSPDKAIPGSACYAKGYVAEEVRIVGHNAPIVVRANKSASTGVCSAHAFINTDYGVVQISRLVVHGQDLGLDVFRGGEHVIFESVEIWGPDLNAKAPIDVWNCSGKQCDTVITPIASCGAFSL